MITKLKIIVACIKANQCKFYRNNEGRWFITLYTKTGKCFYEFESYDTKFINAMIKMASKHK